MANPGRIALLPHKQQLLFDTENGNARWYRVFNSSTQIVMGVRYTEIAGDAGKATVVEPGTSMDFLAIRLEVRHDLSTGGTINGSYEALP